MKILSLKLITLYQKKGGSKQLLGIECNFTPTCSEYTKISIEKYGFIKGWKLGLQRIKRCNNPHLIEIIKDEVP